MNLHKGHISIASELGKGTTFIVDLRAKVKTGKLPKVVPQTE